MNGLHGSVVARTALVGLAALWIAGSPGAARGAQMVSVNLALPAPSGGTNVIDLTIEGDVLGTARTDSDSANVSGNMLATLGLAIDPDSYQVLDVQTIEFTGGRLAIEDTSFSLDWGFLIGGVEIQASGIGGTLDTPNPPGLVSGGGFSTLDHEVILDQGTFEATGDGLIGGFMPANPYIVDLGLEPLAATTDATGSITVSAPTRTATRVSWDIEVRVPVALDQVVLEEPDQASVRIVGSAVLLARGQAVLVADPGEVAVPVSTGLEEAAAGATSFARGPGQTEIEWTMETIALTTAASVATGFTDPDDPSNRKQFHLNNASVVVTTERIDTRAATAPRVSIDLRTWDQSTGFETGDGFALAVLHSPDGILFEEKPWVEVRGAAATALNKGRDGAFTKYTTPVGFIPDGTASVRIVIRANTDSNNEHIFWDDLRVFDRPSFRRADCNASGGVDIADPIGSLLWLFKAGTPAPPCLDACDSNDDGTVAVSDVIFTLNWLFRGGATPAAPGPAICGVDATPGTSASCESYPPCE